jgi:uncharacterized protein (DUF427 family)
MERLVLEPGPDHPISIAPNPKHVLVSAGDQTIAETPRAVTLLESGYPGVQYIPREDVDMSLLERSEHRTYCPYKGDCSYYNIRVGDQLVANAVWTYEAPYAAVSEIQGRLAFYPNKVELVER